MHFNVPPVVSKPSVNLSEHQQRRPPRFELKGNSKASKTRAAQLKSEDWELEEKKKKKRGKYNLETEKLEQTKKKKK